jgi:hypothetical protein
MTEQKKQESAKVHAALGEQVIHILGQPQHLHSIQVRHLWEDHFRINVLIGANSSVTQIAHSYFVQMGEHGNILSSTPKLKNVYAAPEITGSRGQP